MIKTTVYTCCDKKYEDFMSLFAHSVLYHNDDVSVEIGVEEGSLTHMRDPTRYVLDKYDRFKVTYVSFDKMKLGGKVYGVCPNVVRFITTPNTVNDYVYICDVDIITLQKGLTQLHLDDMKTTGLNYSNIVRPNSEIKRLTGLHFSKWDSYYPINGIEELAAQGVLNHDEVFLYNFVAKKNDVSEKTTFRPVHGIHVSPNRAGLGKMNKWKQPWVAYRSSRDFLYLEKYFSNRARSIIQKIDEAIR